MKRGEKGKLNTRIWMLIGINIGPGVGIHLPEELAYLVG